MKIAVILFAYNRPKYLRKAMASHRFLKGLDYYCFIDYSEKQREILDLVADSGIYDKIYLRLERYGLNRNITEGITEIFKIYDAVIVLEDDLLLSRDAIFWLKESLHFTDTVSLQESDINYPFRCWGWGMWKSTWEHIDWDLVPKEKNRGSWDVIVNENFRQKEWTCKYPDKPKVKHIGWSGVHYNYLDLFSVRRLLRKLLYS